MNVYNIDGVQIATSGMAISLEHGTITNNGETSNSLSAIATTYRSAYPLEVTSKKVSASVSKNADKVSGIRVFEYTSDFAFIRSQALSNGVATLANGTRFIRFTVTLSAADYEPCALVVDGGECIKNFRTRASYEKFVFEVYPGVYSSGVMILPPNYDPSGQPVPLLVYIHGSNAFCEWDTAMGVAKSGTTRFPLMQYLSNEGFAVLDIYGWTTKYMAIADSQPSSEPNKSNTHLTPITYSSYRSGIKYALSRYNLGDVSIYCKSLGGALANTFAVRSDIDLTAICELAPTVDVLFWGGWGQSVAARTIIADQLKFTGNVDSVFLQQNFDFRSTAGNAFMLENLDKISGFNPGWNYNGKTLAQKYQDSYDKNYENTEYCREVLYPIKVWIAPDDVNVSYDKVVEFVAQCKNNSKDVTLRLMPENTGGHYSVDTDPNAPKSSGTTALGITYTNIPTAYVEMVEFIRSRA